VRLFRLSLGVSAAALAAIGAFGQTPIGSNTTITEPGSYQLTRDLTLDTSGQPSLMIMASGVTIDLNGHEISGPGNNTGTGIEIMNAGGVQIFNGRLSNLGFGVVVMNSSNVTIHDLNIRASGLAVSAPPPETGIMIVESTGVVVNHNNLYDVGLGIFVRGGMSHGNRITNNNVIAGANGAFGICYNPAPNDPAGPSGDFVANNSIYGFPTGISVTSTAGVNVYRDNNIFFTDKGIAMNGAPAQELDNTMFALN
jgi:Right handed beta helix region